MSTTTPSDISSSPADALYERVHSYPYDSDPEFQSGLRAILGAGSSDAESTSVPPATITEPDRINALTLRAQCYYFSRREGIQVDFEGYRQWLEDRQRGMRSPDDSQQSSLPHSVGTAGRPVQENGEQFGLPATTAESEDGLAATAAPTIPVANPAEARKPASFAAIVEMISEGKPIPGIKDIPDTILEGQSSASTARRRLKPWEKEETAVNGEISG